MTAVLRLHAAAVRRGERELGPWTLDLAAGELLALTGHNGAGKSTLLALAAGLLVPSDGSVQRPSCTGYAPEPFHAPPRTRVSELLHLADPAPQPIIAALDLHDLLNHTLGTLSRGQLKRVLVAQALLGAPAVLLLDEPLEGLDPRQIAHVLSAVHAYIDAGGAALVATHRAPVWEHAHTRVHDVQP